ncbi:uncharacterized protein LOC123779134 isoform X1 [Ursus americanus]|uniref:uncharacterized protein LOC123779134 isoform X1 n=1 Tax=Ursus americanus TaxID=9643 RepID=UPI001E67A8A0|nr:uncharacterized protein LOC123779134 isoform X1 [Ursus americanus]XP_045632889.1 uncharacterized protein LOC123779134 isoform X1 [Ursus americanus]XP_045632890.1 uncharacterized protein LOC123779134 isoform X1 [Ursus americanus]XP_045632891.1 uncharacterized protein LOC123779134 isoform X1 [Ursus americanus]XP_045632892.1 uncharacterized protein LOC123779134 isoform X1 [Ursus americanus]XP_045632893.1 uncharacterized protein LOC123779134 isoform X1 [Ursus americanus]XP_045632895.1 uncharac
MGTETHRHGEGQVRTEACASCYRLWPSSWRFLRMARETAGRVFPPLRSPSVGSLGSRVTLSRWCPSPPPRAHHSWGWLPAPAEGLLAAQHGVRCGLGPWLCPCMYQDSPRSMVTLSSSSEPVEGPPSSCWFALLGHRCPESTNVAEGGALSHLPSCSARVPGKDHTERPFMAWQTPPALSAFIRQPVRGTGRPAAITGPCPASRVHVAGLLGGGGPRQKQDVGGRPHLHCAPSVTAHDRSVLQEPGRFASRPYRILPDAPHPSRPPAGSVRLSDEVWGGAGWERAKLDVEEGDMLGHPRNAWLTLDSGSVAGGLHQRPRGPHPSCLWGDAPVSLLAAVNGAIPGAGMPPLLSGPGPLC